MECTLIIEYILKFQLKLHFENVKKGKNNNKRNESLQIII